MTGGWRRVEQWVGLGVGVRVRVVGWWLGGGGTCGVMVRVGDGARGRMERSWGGRGGVVAFLEVGVWEKRIGV